MQIITDEVYILHTRAYRETSQLTDLLSENHGRLRVVHRGGKKQKIQPFSPAIASWSGHSDLKTLRSVEPLGKSWELHGVTLFSGLYINELLTKVLHEYDPHPEIFSGYHSLMKQLGSSEVVDIPLRHFERLLLEQLGYGYEINFDALTGDPINVDQWYWFEPDQGFLARTPSQENHHFPNWVRGKNLSDLAKEDFEQAEVRKTLKRIHQLAFNRLLGGKPLNSSRFFYNDKKYTVAK